MKWKRERKIYQDRVKLWQIGLVGSFATIGAVVVIISSFVMVGKSYSNLKPVKPVEAVEAEMDLMGEIDKLIRNDDFDNLVAVAEKAVDGAQLSVEKDKLLAE